MNQAYNPKIQLPKLLNSFSIKEIVAILLEIDTKITNLNECSSEDFLAFNNQLKSYYKQAGTISGTATQIFDFFADQKAQNVFNDLNHLQEKLKIIVVIFEKQINFSIKTLEKIWINLNLIFVPLKNFNQNLMTLKFLFANFKFNLTYFDDEYSQQLNNHAQNVDNLISEIKSGYPIIIQTLYTLKDTIKETIDQLKEIRERNAINAETLLDQIHISIHFLSEKHKEAILKVPKLKERTEHCFNSVSNIITNIQFQDIIRQKMEHIQTTHKDIIEELKHLDEPSEKNGLLVTQQTKLFMRVRDIAGLQIAQLMYTNKEFQNAISTITRKFSEIDEDMNNISSMTYEFSGLSHQTDLSHFREIESKLKNVIDIIERFENINFEYTLEIDNIHIAIERISGNFNNIFDLEKKLEDLAASTIKIHPGTAISESELAIITLQIKNIFADAYTITNNLQELYNQTLNLSLGLLSEITNEKREEELRYVGNQFMDLSYLASKILQTIISDNSRVHNMLKESSLLADNVSSEIKTSVESIKYYDFYESTIEQIIMSLNKIYLKLHAKDDSEQNRIENLKSIQNLYTVKSEHIIHENILSDKNNLHDHENQELAQEDDNVELF